MKNSKPRRAFLGRFAVIVAPLIVVAFATASARADGPRRQYRAGGYVNRPVYRAAPYRRPYNGGWGGYRVAPNYAPARGYYAPRLYVPPARTYYGPPAGYYPPMM